MRSLFGLCWAAAVLHAHAIGFQTFVLKDPTRSGGPMTAVAVHVWYPAQEGSGRALTTYDYLSLRVHPNEIRPMTAEQLRVAAETARFTLKISGGRPLEPAVFRAHLDRRVAARLDAVAAPGRWPLVLGGFEGAHTASVLGEHLASRGYVVASFVSPPAIGALQVNRPQQAIEHVARTYESLLAELDRQGRIDAGRVAAIGVNFNGLGALVFQMRTSKARVVVTMDGVENRRHGTGYLMANPWFVPTRLTAPWLAFVRDEMGDTSADRTVFERLKYSDRTWVQIRGMGHINHFVGNNVLPGQRPDVVEGHAEMLAQTTASVEAALKGGRDPERRIHLFKAFEHKSALPPVPEETEIERGLMTSLRATLSSYAEALRRDSELNLLTEQSFDVYAFRYRSQNRLDDVVVIREAVADMFNESPRAALQLATALEEAGRRDDARVALADARKRLSAVVNPDQKAQLASVVEAVERRLRSPR